MDNKININSKRFKFDDYVVVGCSGDKMEMLTNLKPEELLVFLMPMLIELDKKFDLIDNVPRYCN